MTQGVEVHGRYHIIYYHLLWIGMVGLRRQSSWADDWYHSILLKNTTLRSETLCTCINYIHEASTLQLVCFARAFHIPNIEHPRSDLSLGFRLVLPILKIWTDWRYICSLQIMCISLSSIDLPSVKILVYSAFASCANLMNVKFGTDLESIRPCVFNFCHYLERITLPLRDDMITHDNIIFQGCGKWVHEIVAAFLMDEWKNDMNVEIDAINRILPNASAGVLLGVGEKAQAIRAWIRLVLRKYNHYKSEHRRYLN